jgi:3',5'-cyclic-AMP phosphodiesterase
MKKTNSPLAEPLDRRRFLKSSALATFSFLLSPHLRQLFSSNASPVRFGLISDLHKDIIHDADLRLQTFLTEMETQRPHALIQLGDFAIPKAENQAFIDKFNRGNDHVFHVLGNHDLDEGYTAQQVIQSYGMPARYYACSVQGIRVLVLDGNEAGSPKGGSGYASYIGKQQQAWLTGELEAAKEPVLVISHQPLAGIYTVDNAAEMQALLSRFASKILLAINGHAHVDQQLVVGGVRYLHLNSASYYWVGAQLAHQSLAPSIHAQHPSLALTCPYAEVLFALLTIDPQAGTVTIAGRESKWIGPSPAALGYTILNAEEQVKYLQPKISNRIL